MPKRLVLLSAILLLAAAALALVTIVRRPEALASRPPSARPTLLLLTSLPIEFGSGFSLRNNGSALLEKLDLRYRVVPISVTDARDLAKGRLLLMAQPLAQPAEDLVTLDRWVRSGGRTLLFADPMLEWPNERPLGDPLNPPPAYMDTGLLAHWGLRLDGPDQRGTETRELAGRKVLTVSPGSLHGSCQISKDRLVAHCAIGKGQAVVVADADLLDGRELGREGEQNLDAVLVELDLLERD